MTEEKIVKLNIEKNTKQENEAENQTKKTLHTNPIVKKMILATFKTKNMKFKFKDLFR